MRLKKGFYLTFSFVMPKIARKTKMENELISIIVPVYNVELYLERCVNSILKQSYTNSELILIDDGSTDSSPKLCDDFARKDSRIKVVHKQNGGQSEARNTGVNLAKGGYIAFIDSDDYVLTDYFEYLYSLFTDDIGISCCGFERVTSDKCAIEDTENEITVLSREEACTSLFTDSRVYSAVWGKLFRQEIAKQVHFSVGRYAEDVAIICKFLLSSNKKISVGSRKLYCYFNNPKSTLGAGGIKLAKDSIWATFERASFIESKGLLSGSILAWNQFATEAILFCLRNPKEKNYIKPYIKRFSAFQKENRIPRGWYTKLKLNFVAFAPYVYRLLKGF